MGLIEVVVAVGVVIVVLFLEVLCIPDNGGLKENRRKRHLNRLKSGIPHIARGLTSF